jgi:hypothetical protein
VFRPSKAGNAHGRGLLSRQGNWCGLLREAGGFAVVLVSKISEFRQHAE